MSETDAQIAEVESLGVGVVSCVGDNTRSNKMGYG